MFDAHIEPGNNAESGRRGDFMPYGSQRLFVHACFNQFKQWCSRSGISTSQRRFTPASLHLNVKPPDYPFLGAKAYNCRVVTAW